MKELFDKFLMYFCFAGIGTIAVVAFVRVTLNKWKMKNVKCKIRKFILHSPFYILHFLIPILCVAGLIVYGSTKNNSPTNDPPVQTQMIMQPGQLVEQRFDKIASEVVEVPPVQKVGEAALQSVASMEPPASNALVRVEKWWRRGAYDDGQILIFDEDWCFPYGTNHLTSIEVWASGAVYPSMKNPMPIAGLASKLSLAPDDTEVFMGRTTNNTYRIEWHNGHPNRDLNQTADASIELFRNGNVLVTENGLTSEFPYDIPFAHDGFGQDEDWVRANFDLLQQIAPSLTNAEEIVAVGYANWVYDQVGVGLTNGLYKFTALFEDDPPEPTQLYIGDYSVCVTNAGVYTFVLEKGEEYEFGTWPFNDDVDYWAQDDLAADAPMLTSWWGGWESPGEWTIDGGDHWLDYPGMPEWGYRPGWCCWLPTLQGSPNVGHLGVASFPQSFEAILSDYCGSSVPSYQWSSSDPSMEFSTPHAPTTTVTCASIPSWNTCTMSVQVNLGGLSLWSYLHPTYGTNDTPRVGVSLSCQSVLFINDDHRSSRYYEVDVSVVSDISTNGQVRISHSGDTEPEFYSDLGTNRVELLNEPFVANNEFQQSFFICPQQCGRGNLIAECTTADGELISFTNSYRVVEPICSIVNSDMNSGYDHFLNPSKIVLGESARIRVGVAGGEFSPNEVNWMVLGAETVRTNEWELVVKANSTNEAVVVCAAFNDDVEQPIVVMPSVSKRILPVKGFVVSHPSEVDVDPDAIRYMIDWANIVYRQAGIEFVLTNTVQDVGSVEQWDLTYTKWVDEDGERRLKLSDAAQSLLDTYSQGDCIEIYLVGNIKDVEPSAHGMSPAAVWTPKGIIVRHDCSTALPHELGHALGLSDCYDYVGQVELPDLHNPVCASQFSHSDQDFYGGALGRGFYSKKETRQVILQRLLMYGISSGGGSDIPLGAVKAFPDFEASNPEEDFVGVGWLYFHESDGEVFSR